MLLAGEKSLKTFPGAGNENYLNRYGEEWRAEVGEFLER
jgi:hypothetical protein